MRLNVEYYKFNFRRCFGIELEFGSDGITKEDLQIIISENSYKSVIVSAHGSSKNNNFWHLLLSKEFAHNNALIIMNRNGNLYIEHLINNFKLFSSPFVIEIKIK
jgi:hypothetical protein